MLNLTDPEKFEEQMERLKRGAIIHANKDWEYKEPKAHPVFIMDEYTKVEHHRPTNLRCPFGYIKTVHNNRFFYRCNG